MKKVFFTTIFFLISTFMIFGQEDLVTESSEQTEINQDDFSEESETEDLSDFDDFDSIFADAEDVDEAVIEEPETKSAAPIQVLVSAFSSMVHFSGNFTADAGVAYFHTNEDKFSGVLTIMNTLYMTVSPIDSFSIRGSFETGYSNGFTITVPTFYFDYFLLNRIFISAGKKSLTWGYTRLFSDSTYYGCGTHSYCLYSTGPLYTNIFNGDSSPLCLEIRYPWSTGTITFAVTGSFNGDIKPERFNYYGSLEFSVLNTSINLFVKRPSVSSLEDRSFLGGLEVKRTIFGFDTYVQGIAFLNDITHFTTSKSYNYIVGTAGIYRLFESFDPNIGFNIEYQYEFNPAADNRNIHRIAFEGGLKRLGNKKNMKLAVISHFNFTELHGYSGLNFIVSGLLPYADWSTKAAVGYGKKYNSPVFMISTGLSLALDY